MVLHGQNNDEIDKLIESLNRNDLTETEKKELYIAVYGDAADVAMELQNVIVAQDFIEAAINERNNENIVVPENIEPDYLCEIVEMNENAENGLKAVYQIATQKFYTLTEENIGKETADYFKGKNVENKAYAQHGTTVIRGFNKNVSQTIGTHFYGNILNKETVIDDSINDVIFDDTENVTKAEENITLAGIKGTIEKSKETTEFTEENIPDYIELDQENEENER